MCINYVKAIVCYMKTYSSHLHIGVWSFLILSVPTNSVVALFLFQGRHSGYLIPVYQVVLGCFFISLILYHLYFWTKQSRTPKNVTKYIDYVYLTYSFLGLLSAAASIYQQDIDVFKAAIVKQGAHYVRESNARYQSSQSQRCGALKDPELCRALEDLEQESKRDAVLLTSAGIDSLFNLMVALQHIKSIQGRLKALRVAAPPMEDSVENLLELTIDMPDDDANIYSDNFGKNRSRELGFFLLAAAVALRVTRVTIELREWFAAS